MFLGEPVNYFFNESFSNKCFLFYTQGDFVAQKYKLTSRIRFRNKKRNL